jgi:hypothetical protein
MMRALAVVQENAMSSICEELAKLLSTVQRPGDFFASGRLGLPAPRLTVDGVGEIALPLLPVQAGQLIGLAERAPYGRGPETIVDTNVRNTWQIEPRLRLAGKDWQATIDHAVALAAAGLGVVEEPVTAELYKLLIYDKDSFFVGHRATPRRSPACSLRSYWHCPRSRRAGRLWCVTRSARQGSTSPTTNPQK